MSTPQQAWPTEPSPTLKDPDAMLGPIPGLARCDRCGYRPYVSALIMTEATMAVLYFCGHHFRIHEAEIRAQATEVRDERHRLTEDAAAHRPIGGVK